MECETSGETLACVRQTVAICIYVLDSELRYVSSIRFGYDREFQRTRYGHVAFQHTLHRNLAQIPVSTSLKHPNVRILDRYPRVEDADVVPR